MKVFESLNMAYYNIEDPHAGSQVDTYWPTNISEMRMMIETRPIQNKLTLTIANLTEGTIIRFVNINVNIDVEFDVDLFLEDSQRNFLNSF